MDLTFFEHRATAPTLQIDEETISKRKPGLSARHLLLTNVFCPVFDKFPEDEALGSYPSCLYVVI